MQKKSWRKVIMEREETCSFREEPCEAETLARLKGCPYIVEAQDSWIQETDGNQWRRFLRKERLKSLEELLHERPLTEEEALRMMTDLCRALEQCERERILHGAIGPENILITAEGRAKLGGFGMSRKIAGIEVSHSGTARSDVIGLTAEQSGSAVSPANITDFSYMSPELYHGQKPDCTADIYSLGIVFYRIMNRGREPFVSNEKQLVGYGDRRRALEKRMNGAALPSPVDASPEFGRILQKACAFGREDRYQHADGLRRKLERCQRSSKNRLLQAYRSRNRKSKAAVTAALLFLLCIVGYQYWQKMPVQTVPERMDGFTGSLSRDGTLTLEGKGTLEQTVSLEEWEYRDQIKRLVIHGEDTEIQEHFGQCSSLKKVELSGVAALGSNVFYNCRNLQEISFPPALKRIGNQAFEGCLSLQSVELPEGVETIEHIAFCGCKNLTRVEIPASVKSIGAMAFSATAWMEEQKRRGEFLIINDILLEYFGEKQEVVISQDMGIRSIAECAFQGNKTLQNVILADSVEEIGSSAFSECSALESVVLPKELKELPDGVFRDCWSLENIQLPDGVERIGSSAFSYCRRLRNISIPESVTWIGSNAFLNTARQNELAKSGEYIILDGFLIRWTGEETELEIPENLRIRRVADGAFAGKERLKSVVIPEGVISLGQGCFKECKHLEQIVFPKSLTEIGQDAVKGTRWLKNLEQAGGSYQVNGVEIKGQIGSGEK